MTAKEFEKSLKDPNWYTPKKKSDLKRATLALTQDKKFRYVSISLESDEGVLYESFPIPNKKFEEEPEFNADQIKKEFLKLADKFLEG